MQDEKQRCEACPFHVMAEAFAAAVAEKLCPKERQKQAPETLISPDVAAARLGKSRTWLDRRRHTLPFVRLRDTRGYDVLESALDRWLASRR